MTKTEDNPARPVTQRSHHVCAKHHAALRGRGAGRRASRRRSLVRSVAGCMAAPLEVAPPRASGMGIGDTGNSHATPSPSGWQHGICSDRLVTHSRHLQGCRCCGEIRVRADVAVRSSGTARPLTWGCLSFSTTLRMVHSVDDGLPAVAHGHVLNDDTLLAAGPVSSKRFDLSRKSPGQFVEGALGAVLLRNVLDVIETTREGHHRVVNGGHLRASMASTWSVGFMPCTTDNMKFKVLSSTFLP